MTHRNAFTRIGFVSALGACTIALSGCMGPTYGTDKTATEQLFEDLGSSLSLGRRGERKVIQYKPRPGLVEPENTDTLPPPQQNIAEASQEWPESQEERLIRVRAEADEGRVRPGLSRRSDIVVDRRSADPSRFDRGSGSYIGVPANRDERRRTTTQVAPAASATPSQRIYLTDPPTDYRQPADTAAYGDLGESERTKERRRERVGEEKSGLRRLVPWL